MMRGIHRKEKARERDVLSIGVVIARRQGFRTTNLFKTKHLLATENSAVSAVSNQFMRDEKGSETLSVPPALHLSRVAAAIWLEVGLQDKLDITTKQLVASCVRALSVNPAIIIKIRHNLRKINPGNVDQYEAIISQPRYLQMSMDSVLGQPHYVNTETAVKIFEKLKEDIVAEERGKALVRQKARSKKNNEVLSKKAKEAENLALALETMNDSRKRSVEAMLIPKWERLSWQMRILTVGIILVGILGLVGSTYLSGVLLLVSSIISAIILVYGLFGLTIKHAQDWVREIVVGRMKSNLLRLGFDDLIEVIEINPRDATLRWRAIPPTFELTGPDPDNDEGDN